MTPRKLKPKKCKVCKQEFMPFQPLQFICLEMSCLMSYTNACKQRAETRRRTNERRLIREAREKLKTRSDYIREADAAFSKYIRERDKNKPCICCGMPLERKTDVGGHCDAGHWISRKHMATRYDEANVHAQRKYCNRYRGGNPIGMRGGIILRLGIAEIERLEKLEKEIRHFSTADFIEIRDTYKQKLKQLTKELQNGLVDRI